MKKGKLDFGKYKGYHIDEILEINPYYIQWCVDNELLGIPQKTIDKAINDYRLDMLAEEAIRESIN